MSRPVCVPVRVSDEFLRGFGAARRRMELEGISVKCSAPELGVKFGCPELSFRAEPERLEAKTSPAFSPERKALPHAREQFDSFLEMLRRKRRERQFVSEQKAMKAD